MTFKEARAQARENCRSNTNHCLCQYKDGGWFVGNYADSRAIYFVYLDGRIVPLRTPFAQAYHKNYLKKISKKA